jgi:hypothetical protein
MRNQDNFFFAAFIFLISCNGVLEIQHKTIFHLNGNWYTALLLPKWIVLYLLHQTSENDRIINQTHFAFLKHSLHVNKVS